MVSLILRRESDESDLARSVVVHTLLVSLRLWFRVLERAKPEGFQRRFSADD